METGPILTGRLKLAAGGAAILLLAGWLAWGGSHAPSRPVDASAQPADGVSAGAPAPADASASEDSGAGGLDDILEEQNGDLVDVLAVLPRACATAAPRGAGRLAVAAVETCVADAEESANLVSLVRESVESPAGAEMPGDVQTRWGHALLGDAHTITRAIDPVAQTVGEALASGRMPPAEFRALGQLRDRLDRVRATLNL